MIQLQSRPQKVVEIKKPTKAAMFANVEVGDVLRFEIGLKHTGYASRGTYATTVKVTNVTKGETTEKSQSEMANILNRSFELQEL